jgi:short-subunit dehydrogenase
LQQEDGVKRIWIEADLSRPEAATEVAQAIAQQPLHVLIYNVGIWETTAFSEDYDFAAIAPQETQTILQVNLTAAIICIQAVLPNLRRETQSKVILIGSICGVDNSGSMEVAFAASKFGLRGVAHALRENLRSSGIPVTCLNPGMIATEVPFEAGVEEAIAQFGGTQIPVHDVVTLVRSILSLSPATCIKEVQMPALTDTWA